MQTIVINFVLIDNNVLFIRWVHSGKAYLQDRHGIGHQEPQIDRHQDWTLIAGYENDTHTTLIMSRDYNTCDKKDHVISVRIVPILINFLYFIILFT